MRVCVCSQGHNLEDCYAKLQEMVDAAWVEPKVRALRTGIAQTTKSAYVQEKRMRSQVKRSRSTKYDD